ncbi:MAG: dolichyl-phosphate beta-D-mannosyltransferase [Elusimicrobia bacterium RIFCSPLOWO2_02_FULL_39_32]|nr:MAG: dolichyl-phosphate beta-D-mannosyltransferase [Elusimicrobia bacterium GWA2_38_7]OGR78968.1 MAG: dolichyl-phosphate beta-D-mannosyltransferase [Elusimicrobia bacterium RIFCSPHIGHO2_02_FULL_39_36]OGR92552.1 MAG: dolichyl-phosphate beta-D-mannosyltransferase [Elusimicrobia bacterium RIFCSPLOWO2_02_FULL_39_32]OGR99200.1 MAG: dolichyl-phosphate beta-D-mannosyltransferase [Elusimicrobia bacterium RIFCSPLOWO2_12_FULL_39_28]
MISNRNLIILPTYNEKDNIILFISQLLSRVKADVLVIDDNSPDNTGFIVEQMAKEHPSIFVLHRPHKMGLGSAYVAGFKWALEKNYEIIIQMDSDFSHDPSDLNKLLDAMPMCDFALGSRYVDGGTIQNWPWVRLWVSSFGSFYARTVLGMEIQDFTTGFKVFKKKVIESFNLEKILSDGYAFQIETTYKAIQNGFKVKEIPITFKDRTRGQSKISRRVVWEALWIVWRLKFAL